MDPSGNAIAHIHQSLYSPFITWTQSMLLIGIHSTRCSIKVPAELADQQKSISRSDPKSHGPTTLTSQRQTQAVIQALPKTHRRLAWPKPIANNLCTVGSSVHGSKRALWGNYDHSYTLALTLSAWLTGLRNKPPNHRLAARNLSSSCEQTWLEEREAEMNDGGRGKTSLRRWEINDT